MIPEMLAGGVCTGLGALFGRYLPARRRAPKPVRPICGCGHNVAYHQRNDDTYGPCQHSDYEQIHTSPYQYHDELVRCTCPGYYGPEPLPEYIPREIAS